LIKDSLSKAPLLMLIIVSMVFFLLSILLIVNFLFIRQIIKIKNPKSYIFANWIILFLMHYPAVTWPLLF